MCSQLITLFGLSPKRPQDNDALSSFFKILSTTTDTNNKAYISTAQAYKYYVTAFQWHPERYKASNEVEGQMQVLLASPTIQEKLSSERKCVLPKVLLEDLAGDKEIKSNTMITRDLDRFIESLG